MRIAMMGSGGIGGYFGGRLAANGCDVTFIARGSHLAAIRERGLRIDSRELGDAITFNAPLGGMFLWARLSAGRDATEFAKRAIERQVAFVPGVPFYAQTPDRSTLRLSFATVDRERLEDGVKRLGQAL